MKLAPVSAMVLLAAVLAGLGSDSARAQEPAALRAVILPDLIPSVVQQIVPITVELPADRAGTQAKVKLAAIVYCGGDGQGGASTIGAVYPDGAAAPSNPLPSGSCQGQLSDLAGQLAHADPAPRWVEVVAMRVTWAPWRLRLASADVARAGQQADQAPALNNLADFKTIATSNLQVLPPPGQNNRFDVAIGFRKADIVAAAFPAGSRDNPEPYLSKDPLLDSEIAAAPTSANLLADAQYAFINQMLKLYAPIYQVPVQLQGMPQALAAKDVAVAGGDNTLTVTGKLEYGDVAGYQSTLRCDGEDLKVSRITLDAPAADCSQTDILAQMQCQGRQAAMAMSSNALASGLTNYYQGRSFHYSTSDHPLPFAIGDRQFTAAFDALKSSSKGSTFSEAGRVTIQRVSADSSE